VSLPAVALLVAALSGCGWWEEAPPTPPIPTPQPAAGGRGPGEPGAATGEGHEGDLLTLSGVVPSADGTPIAYESVGSGDPALVFIHGWACDMTYWAAQVGALSSLYRTVTLDLAGHGDAGSDRDDYTMESFAQDVRAVVEALDLHDVVLVGHAMGAVVMLEAAPLLRGRVVALVAVDALHDVERRPDPGRLGMLIEGFGGDYSANVEAFVRESFFAPSTDPELVQEVAMDMGSGSPAVGLSAMRHLMGHDTARALERAALPVRCLNGETRRVDATVGGKHAPSFEVVLIPGAGHFPMLEQPVLFNRELELAVEEMVLSRR
jgi:pimeloyl-ACP methyl ester carboxylesterase